MFLASFEPLRDTVLEQFTVSSMIHIGERGFDSIGGAVVSTTAFVLNDKKRGNDTGVFVRLVEGKSETEKATMLRKALRVGDPTIVFRRDNSVFRRIPGRAVVYWASEKTIALFEALTPAGELLDIRQGMATTDNETYVRLWYELSADSIMFRASNRTEARASGKHWFPFNKGGSFRRWFGNQEFVVRFENDGEDLIDLVRQKYPRISDPEFVIKNRRYFFRPCISWSDITTGVPAFRLMPEGFIFDVVAPSAFSKDSTDLYPYLAFFNSKVAAQFAAILNPSIHFTLGDLKTLPIADRLPSEGVKELVDIHKWDWDSRETSWDLLRNSLIGAGRSMLEESYAKFVINSTASIETVRSLEEENNRRIISL